MERPLTQNIKPGNPPPDLKQYEAAGGYQAARTALRDLQPADVARKVKDSNLRGRGGAGFPTGMKWSFVPMGPDAPQPKYLVANADEMEPGTFKDRLLLEGDPHQVIEGMILAAYAIQAAVAYIFLRAEYAKAEGVLRNAVAEAYRAGYLGKNILGSAFSLEMHHARQRGTLHVRRRNRAAERAGGETRDPALQTAVSASQRAVGQRHDRQERRDAVQHPPHRRATAPDWFRKLEPDRRRRHKAVRRERQGEDARACGNCRWARRSGKSSRNTRAECATGSGCAGLCPAALRPISWSRSISTCRWISRRWKRPAAAWAPGRSIVLDDQTCPVGMVHNLEAFFARESCGWCTPCREGLPWTEKILGAIEEGEGRPEHLDRLELHTRLLGPGRTFCALAPGAMEPLQSALKYFREDFERHIREQRCPWR